MRFKNGGAHALSPLHIMITTNTAFHCVCRSATRVPHLRRGARGQTARSWVIRRRLGAAILAGLLTMQAQLASANCPDALPPAVGGLPISPISPPPSRAITIQGDYAVMTGEGGLSVFDLTNPEAPVLVATVALPIRPLWTSFVDGLAYVATLDLQSGAAVLFIVDIRDPPNARVLGSVSLPYTRHYGVLEVANGVVYIPDSGSFLNLPEILIIDARTPSAPVITTRMPMPGFTNSVAVANGFAYVGVQEVFIGPRIHVFDLSDPLTPVLVSDTTPFDRFALLVPVPGSDRPPAGTSSSLATEGPFLYGISHFAIQTFDLTVPTHPLLLQRTPYWAGGGVPVPELQTIANGFLYMPKGGGRSGGGVGIIDIRRPAEPVRYATVVPTNGHNVQTVAVRGPYAYLVSDAFAFPNILILPPWLEVVDLRRVRPPVAAADLALPRLSDFHAAAFLARDAVVVRNDRAFVIRDDRTDPDIPVGQISVVDVTDPRTPMHVTTIPTGAGAPTAAAVTGNALIVMTAPQILEVYDITEADHPVLASTLLLSTTGFPQNFTAVVASGDFAYVSSRADTSWLLSVVNVANPSAAAVVGQLALTQVRNVRDMVFLNDRVYLHEAEADSPVGIDVRDPTNPVEIQATWPASPLLLPPLLSGLHGEGNLLYGIGEDGLLVWDVTDPTTPLLLSAQQIRFQGPPNSAMAEGFLYLGGVVPGIQVWDVRDPTAPVRLAGPLPKGPARAIAIKDGFILASETTFEFPALNAVPSLETFAICLQEEPGLPTIDWIQPPLPQVTSGSPIPVTWELRDFAGPITEHRVVLDGPDVHESSPLQPLANGQYSYTFTAPEVTEATTHIAMVQAFDDGVEITSPLRAVVVEPAAVSGGTIAWLTPPAASAVGNEAMPLTWDLADFAGTITANQAHLGIRSVLKSSPEQPGTNGLHTHTFAAPNVGTFDAPTTYKFAAAARDAGTLIVSPIEQSVISVGATPPTVSWITPPPTSAESGSQFTVAWALTNYVDPAPTNAAGWGITRLLGKTADQPGGDGIYGATVDVPVVTSEGTLFYTAFAANPIEFAFAPITPVQITLGGGPTSFPAADLFPIAPNTSWTYQGPGGVPITVTVQPDMVDINGTLTAEFLRSDGRQRFWTNDAQGLRFHRELDLTGTIGTYSPPFPAAQATVTLGDTVSGSGTIELVVPGQAPQLIPYTSTFTAEAFESVTVPAGTFSAVRTQGTIDFGPAGMRTATVWSAPGLGIVREVDSVDGTRELIGSSLLP